MVLTSSAPAAALTPGELERARAVFQRGVELAARGDYANAAKRFREALAIHPAPAVAYNLASALFELGQHAEAYNLAHSVLAASDTPEPVRVRAQQLEQTLESRVARLTVIVGVEGRAGVREQNDRRDDGGEITIRVDGERLDPPLIGVARAVAPGKHVVVAERGGTRISEREVDIPLRTAALVDVSLVATPRQAAESALADGSSLGPIGAPDRSARDDGMSKRRRRIWWIAGAGAVAVGAGVALAVVLARRDGGSEAPVSGDANPGVLVWK